MWTLDVRFFVLFEVQKSTWLHSYCFYDQELNSFFDFRCAAWNEGCQPPQQIFSNEPTLRGRGGGRSENFVKFFYYFGFILIKQYKF